MNFATNWLLVTHIEFEFGEYKGVVLPGQITDAQVRIKNKKKTFITLRIGFSSPILSRSPPMALTYFQTFGDFEKSKPLLYE